MIFIKSTNFQSHVQWPDDIWRINICVSNLVKFMFEIFARWQDSWKRRPFVLWKVSRRFWTRPANLQIRIYCVWQLLFLKGKPHSTSRWWQKSNHLVKMFFLRIFSLWYVSSSLNSFWCLATFARPYVENTFGHMLKIWGFHKVLSSSHQHSGLKLWFTIKISRRRRRKNK